MQALLQEELKMLGSIHLDIFKYFIIKQKQVNQINQAIVKQAKQAKKQATKKTTKNLILLKRETTKKITKKFNTTCRAFRSLDSNIFMLQSFRFSLKKSSQKSSRKTTNYILDASYLPSSQLSPIRVFSSILLSSLLSTSTSRAKRRKASQTTTTKASLIEEKKTPIELSRISRIDRIIRSLRR